MTLSGLSYILKARVRDHMQHINPAIPTRSGAANGFFPQELHFRFRVREGWRR